MCCMPNLCTGDGCQAALRQEESDYNRGRTVLIPLYIACGAAVFTGEDGATIEDAERLADREMYRAKQVMKQMPVRF